MIYGPENRRVIRDALAVIESTQPTDSTSARPLSGCSDTYGRVAVEKSAMGANHDKHLAAVGKRSPHRRRNDTRRRLRILTDPETSDEFKAATLGGTVEEVRRFRAEAESDPLLKEAAAGLDPLAAEDRRQAELDRLSSDLHVLSRRLAGDE